MEQLQKNLSGIYIYPVKSTAGLALTSSPVCTEGLAYDRRWAIIDKENAIITPRECPRLLSMQTSIEEEVLKLVIPDGRAVTVPLAPGSGQLLPVTIFGIPVQGRHVGLADALLSDYLGSDCRLIFMDEDCTRLMKAIHGGGPADRVSFADSAPLLLVSLASLDALNERLAQPVSMKNFRPNLVVAGCAADEEDTWKQLQIGEVLFDVSEACKRCVVTTIDPQTGLQSPRQEPLRTLAAYKRHPRNGVRFGINLIPRSAGTIREGDEVKVIDTTTVR